MNENDKKLGLFITHFGVSVGVIKQDEVVELEEDRLKQVLADASALVRELREKLAKVGRVVDIFWERQGYYIVELETGKTSQEHANVDLAVKSAAAQGYIIREIRRTRGAVPQPKVPLPEKNDAE